MNALPNFAPPHIVAEAQSDGGVLIRSTDPLEPYAASVVHDFRAGSAVHPDRLLIAQRDAAGEWARMGWGAVREQVDRVAQGILNRNLADRAVFILSGNGAQHLIVMLAAMTVGAPVVSVSVAYSLQSRDHAQLKWMADLIKPGLVFAETPAFTDAIKVVAEAATGLAVLGPHRDVDGATTLAAFGAEPTPEVAARCRALTVDTIAKILFTSGSTGYPKGVITTHGMLSANQQQVRQVWPFLAGEPPVLLDWLPWSHTFGGSHDLYMVLTNGGTLWVDDGRPAPTLIERTVRNFADAKPTIYFGVPAVYSAMLPWLERDRKAADAFLARLRLGFFAAAALPQDLWDRLEKLAKAHGSRMQMTTSWGLTETSPAATSAHFPITSSDNLGVPLPGMDLRLAPVGDLLEIRVRGPNITPGYYARPDVTAAAFDEDGFFTTGDAAVLADADDPRAGIVFRGRIAENFKLDTGTFVRVGTLRPLLLSVSNGLINDAIICGENSHCVTAMVWLAADHAARVDAEGMPEERLRAELAVVLQRLASSAEGSSQHVERLLILTEPPQLDAGELTDKGYVNQGITRRRRAALVALLGQDPPHPRIIVRG
ncbi:MAG: AMP-binding protein [Rhodanobacteraceae bacterium]